MKQQMTICVLGTTRPMCLGTRWIWAHRCMGILAADWRTLLLGPSMCKPFAVLKLLFNY